MAETNQLVQQVTEIAGRVAQGYGIELVQVELAGGQGSAILRIYIDKPGGVTHEDCSKVSNEMSVILDVEDLIPNKYFLEVSSPGLDRGLYKPADYERFTGSLVKIKLTEPINGQRNFKGRLQGLRDDAALIVDDQQQEALLPLAKIARARLVPEF